MKYILFTISKKAAKHNGFAFADKSHCVFKFIRYIERKREYQKFLWTDFVYLSLNLVRLWQIIRSSSGLFLMSQNNIFRLIHCLFNMKNKKLKIHFITKFVVVLYFPNIKIRYEFISRLNNNLRNIISSLLYCLFKNLHLQICL